MLAAGAKVLEGENSPEKTCYPGVLSRGNNKN